MTPNTFPVPEGPTASFSTVISGIPTANFSWTERGLYRISWEANDLALGQVYLDLRVVVAGVSTSILTMYTPGYYDVVLGQGGGTYNFATTSLDPRTRHSAKRASMTKVG